MNMRKPTAIEKIALDLISRYYTPQNFEKAVKQNINLAELITSQLGVEWVKAIRGFVSIYKNFTNDGDILTPENVVYWLSLHNPSLSVKIKQTRENYKWFEKQVMNIKRLFGI